MRRKNARRMEITMTLLKEMKTNKYLTEREQDIKKYILEHPEKISVMSSRELGEATFTSAASVTRFCQKDRKSVV